MMKPNNGEMDDTNTAATAAAVSAAAAAFTQPRKAAKGGYVKHDYKDHYHASLYRTIEGELDVGEGSRRGPRGGVVHAFPERLYAMLNDAEENFPEIVGWQPHGRCFLVRQPKRFVSEVMPTYFRQSKLTSFQRQVNLYGFRRLTVSEDRGGYYHELFLRGRPDLNKLITRVRVKGTGCKFKSSPATEPNFYSFPPCTEEGPSYHNDAIVSDSSEDETIYPRSGHNTKKHSKYGGHSGLLASASSTEAGSKDIPAFCGQGGLQVSLSMNSAIRFSHNEAMHVAAPAVDHGDRHTGTMKTPYAVSNNQTARPLPAPRLLPHFQNFQFHPIQRDSAISPELSKQSPTLCSSIALDKYKRVVTDDEDPTSAIATERLVGHPQEEDLFDARIAEMFEKASTPTPITLDDLVQFFVEPMLSKTGVED